MTRERDVDLIAMSTHGHRFLADVLHGATADKVRHLVQCRSCCSAPSSYPLSLRARLPAGSAVPTATLARLSIPRVSDAELVARARDGDSSAFGELVDRHRTAVFRAALAALGSRSDADDATQDAFVMAFERLHTFRGESSFKTWLLTIAWHQAINRRRSVTRWWKRTAAADPDDQWFALPTGKAGTAGECQNRNHDHRSARHGHADQTNGAGDLRGRRRRLPIAVTTERQRASRCRSKSMCARNWSREEIRLGFSLPGPTGRSSSPRAKRPFRGGVTRTTLNDNISMVLEDGNQWSSRIRRSDQRAPGDGRSESDGRQVRRAP